jgi:hypothetical protein
MRKAGHHGIILNSFLLKRHHLHRSEDTPRPPSQSPQRPLNQRRHFQAIPTEALSHHGGSRQHRPARVPVPINRLRNHQLRLLNRVDHLLRRDLAVNLLFLLLPARLSVVPSLQSGLSDHRLLRLVRWILQRWSVCFALIPCS